MHPNAIAPTETRHRLRASPRQVQIIRRLVQLGFVLFIGFVAVQHALLGDKSTSPEAYCPFGGVETLYSFVSGGTFINHSHLSNLVLLGAVMLVAALARGAFCGWVCPFGTIQEWVHGFSRFLQRRIPPFGRAMRALRTWAAPRAKRGQAPRMTLMHRLDRWLRYGRYVTLAAIIGGTVAYGTMVFRDYDPWAALINIAEFELTVGLLVLGVVVLASFVVERPWCRYACPLGAAIGLVSQVSPLRIQREGSACAGCALCTQECPMGIQIETAGDITDPGCIMCLNCLSECPKPTALDLRLVLPVRAEEARG